MAANPSMRNLTAFQRDLLLAVIGDPGINGLALARHLGRYYSGDVNPSRVYTNLDRLADQGLIEKSIDQGDSRANAYRVTDAGLDAIRRHATWRARNAMGTAGRRPRAEPGNGRGDEP